MKTDIHPAYFEQTTITCSCGAVLTVGSAEKNLQTEICSQCHPFYTGKKKVIDSTGRVDRFKKMSERAEAKKAKAKKTKAEKTERKKQREEVQSAEETKA